MGIAKSKAGMGRYLTAEVFTAFVGSIEAESPVVGTGSEEIVDEGAPVTAESCGVAHDALGIKADGVTHFKDEG